MKKNIALSFLIALTLPAYAGEHEHHNDKTQAAASADDYVNAEIKKIDIDNGKVTLKHEALKQFDMPGMTMSFRVTDPAGLGAFAAGDKVRFIPDKVNGQFTVKKIEKLN